MEFKGQLVGFTLNAESRTVDITVRASVTDALWNFLNKHKGLYNLTFKITKGKRSLNANSYFHVLCTNIATAMRLTGLNMSMTEVKNSLIADYGQPEFLDDYTPISIETNIEPDKALQNEGIHLKYIGMTEAGVYKYFMMRGSHTYDTREMAALIEGAVALAKEYNVETLPPDELYKLTQLWVA